MHLREKSRKCEQQAKFARASEQGIEGNRKGRNSRSALPPQQARGRGDPGATGRPKRAAPRRWTGHMQGKVELWLHAQRSKPAAIQRLALVVRWECRRACRQCRLL